MPSSDHYPLAVGNTWTYKMKDGKTFTNTVTGADGASFAMSNSLMNTNSTVKKEGDSYVTDAYQAGTWQVSMKENPKKGDTWNVTFKANGIDTTLIHTVKEVGISKDVEGKTYADVVVIEAESKMSMNGNPIPMQFFTQYYYAKGVGLVLTTTSTGDAMPLVEYTVK
ncbi:MAG: hypothetical protein ACOYZ6_00425 [Chloroflexota bacterium]